MAYWPISECSLLHHRLIILRRKPTLLKLLCSLAVVIGLFICIIPTLFPKLDRDITEETTFEIATFSRVMWPIIFMLGSVRSVLWFLPFKLPTKQIVWLPKVSIVTNVNVLQVWLLIGHVTSSAQRYHPTITGQRRNNSLNLLTYLSNYW